MNKTAQDPKVCGKKKSMKTIQTEENLEIKNLETQTGSLTKII